jgi:adenylylsulfate kinase
MVSSPSPPPPPISGGAVLWFTGLSGAGKSTIASAVDARLRDNHARVELLDGDALRAILPAGFSKEEREAHVRRVGFFASRLEHHGVIVVAALISPYRASRDFARSLCRRFVEIHVATPLEECERRDVKGLYARARSGELRGFTGIDDPYEPPDNPELRIDTQLRSVAESVALVLEHLAASPAGSGK